MQKHETTQKLLNAESEHLTLIQEPSEIYDDTYLEKIDVQRTDED
jgi:hypothetical protein